jgi:hypothetical protein
MDEKTKINSDLSNHIIPKKIFQNPFKKDSIYKSNKIKTKKISKINKDNLLMNSNTIKILNQLSKEKNIINQSLKKDIIGKYFNSNINIISLNKTNFPNKKDRKVDNIDFKKSSAANKQLTEKKNFGDNTQQDKSIFEKNKRKKIFRINSNKNFKKKNYKSIKKNNNTENILNLLNTQKKRFFNKSKLQSDLSISFKELNQKINYTNKATKRKRYLIEKISHNYKKNTRNFTNNLLKSDKLYNSDANILTNRTKSKNKSKSNKKLDNSFHKKNQNTNINFNKVNKESKKILQSAKKSTKDLIKSLNYTIIANNKSANTKPTNISSFVISEKKIEKNEGINNYNKIKEKSPLKSTNFKEHMKFLELNTNKVQILLLDNYNKAKESDSKFLNYELGQSNSLSFTDPIFYSLENPYKNEKIRNKIIECEHSIEYMEKFANDFLNSNKNLPHFLKDKKIKDSYFDVTDNNLSSLDEFKNGENIHRIINLEINLKK